MILFIACTESMPSLDRPFHVPAAGDETSIVLINETGQTIYDFTYWTPSGFEVGSQKYAFEPDTTLRVGIPIGCDEVCDLVLDSTWVFSAKHHGYRVTETDNG